MLKKYRKRKTTKVKAYNPRDFTIEPGDLLIGFDGVLFRATVSRGRNKRDSGDLTPVQIKPPKGFKRAIIKDGEIYWTDLLEGSHE